jgi:hypothetical protein
MSNAPNVAPRDEVAALAELMQALKVVATAVAAEAQVLNREKRTSQAAACQLTFEVLRDLARGTQARLRQLAEGVAVVSAIPEELRHFDPSKVRIG